MYNIIVAAGWPVWPLLITSVLALALLIERFWYLRPSKIAPTTLMDGAKQLSDSGISKTSPSYEQALQIIQTTAPLGLILAAAIDAKFSNHSKEDALVAMQEAADEVGQLMYRYLNVLSTIATVAPLLGLFGTVIGMIEIFGSQQSGQTNPQQLAHGISIALYNTALGLLIAIPAYAGYRALVALAQECQRRCESASKALWTYLYPNHS